MDLTVIFDCSPKKSRDPEKVKAGMPITRSLLPTHEILEFSCDEEGEIMIPSGDYGVMGLPINQIDSKDVQVLHTSLRTIHLLKPLAVFRQAQKYGQAVSLKTAI